MTLGILTRYTVIAIQISSVLSSTSFSRFSYMPRLEDILCMVGWWFVYFIASIVIVFFFFSVVYCSHGDTLGLTYFGERNSFQRRQSGLDKRDVINCEG